MDALQNRGPLKTETSTLSFPLKNSKSQKTWFGTKGRHLGRPCGIRLWEKEGEGEGQARKDSSQLFFELKCSNRPGRYSPESKRAYQVSMTYQKQKPYGFSL